MEERASADQKEQEEFEEQTQEPKTIRDFTREELLNEVKTSGYGSGKKQAQAGQVPSAI